MARIEFPKPLQDLLNESDLQPSIRALADRVGEILADNKLPFFPDYTDHGTDHINRVLKSEIQLVPKTVWKNSQKDSDPQLLCDSDAAVIIGGTLLHDIAMHLRPVGFLELVSQNSRFEPLPWFSEDQEDQPANRSWRVLWEDFQREARRFSERTLSNIIGALSAQTWKFHELPPDVGQWEHNHHLIIGEFIRRHHARLAHEIAIYGFPGLPVGSGEGQFPAMGREEGHPLMRLADLIGLSARSHGMSLRVCKAYLESSPLYPGTPKPMGTAVLYSMALLRVADYFQIDRQRAPAVLLKLRNPQSPISIQEWQKHRAVQNIGPATDPRGKMITISSNIGLSLYLQLSDLLAGLQREMDHSTAVLDEAYGTLTELGLDQLNLAIRRVHSNLYSPAFRNSLPYVPNRTGFSADPNLLTLLVEPLYGKEPSVGIRELIQNSVDAVSELEAWATRHGTSVDSLDLPTQDGDVLIEFIKREDGSWFVRVRDRGIGMTSATIQEYFLRAGASFRRSSEWAKEFLNDDGTPVVIRAGRFGIGVFALFLLGPSFRLWTRHVSTDTSQGYFVEGTANNDLLEIRRLSGLPVGTTIEVELTDESVNNFNLDRVESSQSEDLAKQVDWFCWDWPKIVKRVIRSENSELLDQEFSLPILNEKLPAQWSVINPQGFDAVYWTFERAPVLTCNGLKIKDPRKGLYSQGNFAWPSEVQLLPPNIGVLDRAANLPLRAQRYELSDENLPFIAELTRDITLSFIAHALICGPRTQSEAQSGARVHPLIRSRISRYGERNKDSVLTPFIQGFLRWVATTSHMVPVDPWLYSLMKEEMCLVYGILSLTDNEYGASQGNVTLKKKLSAGLAALAWNGLMVYSEPPQDTVVKIVTRFEQDQEPEWWPLRILTTLAHQGVAALGHEVVASKVVALPDPQFDFTSPPPASSYIKEEHDFGIWKEITRTSKHTYFEASKGRMSGNLPLPPLLKSVKLLPTSDPWERWSEQDRPTVRYVAQIRSKRVRYEPDSLVAQCWNECLGANPIPFDRAERAELIARASKNPELKRHITAWREMKRSRSKWVYGG